MPPGVDEPGPEHETALDARPKPTRKGAAPRVAPGAPIPRVRPAPKATVVPPTANVFASSRSRPRKFKAPLPIVLPITVVLLAVLAALFASGVIGGSDPASSPRFAAPSDTPAGAAGDDADLAPVPGAKDATAAAVEAAKARERARAAGKRAPAAGRKTTPTRPATRSTPAKPPPAATAPPAAAPPPPPPPPPPPAAPAQRADNGDRDGGSRKAKAGSGATGAEQIPPAEDTSDVPDLAPAPEPATPP